MSRVFVWMGALAAFAGIAPAGESTIRLSVEPMRLSTPVLKYQLLPELSELKPGNPAQNYLKCFMEQRTFFYSTKVVADRARYQTMALADLPLEHVDHYGGNALRQADWAARLETLDWEALESIKEGGIDALPTALGPLQILTAALHVRLRGEISGKHFDDAVRSAKTMFALSRHLGEHPTETGSLVGLWAANLTLGTIEEMIEQLGCPNLYWALTALPHPLVEVRRGLQGQRLIVAAQLRPLRDDAPMTETELETFVGRLSGKLSFAREQSGRDLRSVRAILQQRVADPDRVRAARGRLVEVGCAPDKINKLPPMQVILLDEKREYDQNCDERLKVLGLALWEIDSFTEEAANGHGTRSLFADLLPDVSKLKRSQAAVEQRIAVLRQVEALRLYAALHDGDLPGERCALAVPVPVDPITGRPFEYAIKGATAHIRGGSTQGVESGSRQTVHYEVTVRAKSRQKP